jgi:hypothetical protein
VLFKDHDRKFFGLYPGKCVDVADPDSKARIKLKVPQVTGEAISNWAFPCTPVTANAAARAAYIPGLGDTVWVMYVGGDPNFPVWIGVL